MSSPRHVAACPPSAWRSPWSQGCRAPRIGFVGLIAALEEKFGVELDLVEKPIEEFIVLGSLVKQVLGN